MLKDKLRHIKILRIYLKKLIKSGNIQSST